MNKENNQMEYKLVWLKSINLDGYLKELHSGRFTITWKYIDSQYRFFLQYNGEEIYHIDTNETSQRKAWIIGGEACKLKAFSLCEKYDIMKIEIDDNN